MSSEEPNAESEPPSGDHGPEQGDTPAGTGGEAGEQSPPPSRRPAPEVLGGSAEEMPGLRTRLKRLLIGRPRDLSDPGVFKHISLAAFLAWVGLGADGLSSSCYGPPEAFVSLGEHRYLAVFLAAAIVATVVIISACYRHIIEEFPSGGGGYLVASKLLGSRAGVVSGCALVVDYVLTVAVSIASAGDALFSLLDPQWLWLKLYAEVAVVAVLILLNLRGVKESVLVLAPIFIGFVVLHVLLIAGTVGLHAAGLGPIVRRVAGEVSQSWATPGFGLAGMLAVLLHAYSLGAGTYTGLEAVSNSLPVIREPRVLNAKRTMLYMACSLSFMAAGLIVAYLLLDIRPSVDRSKTMNYLLADGFVNEIGLASGWLGSALVATTLLSEGALLVVGAQAGFIDGPRVLGYMAHDGWMPRWFSSLSERLATDNGVLLVGLAALATLWFTRGDIGVLVVMYSINVFLTFSLSMIGMCRHWWDLRGTCPWWYRRLALFATGASLCVTILVVTAVEKFREGGWVTMGVTAATISTAFGIRRYYTNVARRLRGLDEILGQIDTHAPPNLDPPDPAQPTAVVLVGGYSGLGVHTTLGVLRFMPQRFRNFVFVSVGVVDSGNFKGKDAVEHLRRHTQEGLDRYVDLARRLGFSAKGYMAIGTDPVDELEQLCLEVARQFPQATFFAGQLVFKSDTWLHRLLHNQTAYALQRRLHWAGLPMVILPTRVR